MPNYCKLIVAGHVTRSLDTRYTPNQVAIVSSGIAFSHKYKDKESTCFLDWTAFGKIAEILAKHVDKGSSVLLEGRLELDQWEDKTSGVKRSKHKMIVENFQFLDRKKDGAAPTREASPPPQAQPGPGPAPHGPPEDDDPGIPF